MIKNIFKIILEFLLLVFIISIFTYFNFIDLNISRVISLIGLFIILFFNTKKNNSIYLYLTIYSLIIIFNLIFKTFKIKLLLLGIIFLLIYFIRKITYKK